MDELNRPARNYWDELVASSMDRANCAIRGVPGREMQPWEWGLVSWVIQTEQTKEINATIEELANAKMIEWVRGAPFQKIVRGLVQQALDDEGKDVTVRTPKIEVAEGLDGFKAHLDSMAAAFGAGVANDDRDS